MPGSSDRPGWFLTPEARTLRDVYLDLTAERGRVPEVYVDLHHQGACVRQDGTGTVLFEVRGQTQTLGDRHHAHFTRAVVAGLMRMLTDVGTGAVDRLDPESFDTLPGTADRLSTEDSEVNVPEAG